MKCEKTKRYLEDRKAHEKTIRDYFERRGWTIASETHFWKDFKQMSYKPTIHIDLRYKGSVKITMNFQTLKQYRKNPLLITALEIENVIEKYLGWVE